MNFWSSNESNANEKGKLLQAWGNWLLSGRWNHVVSPRLFVNNMFSTTNYRLKINQEFTSGNQIDSIDYKSLYLSRVNDLSFRSDWQYKITNNYNLDFGIKLTALNHIPNKISQSDILAQSYEQILSYENAVYFSNQVTLFSFIDADIGLRAVSFINNGYSKFGIEPRINLNFHIFSAQTLNLSCQKVNQFAHLLLTNGAILKNEIWVPADENIEPSTSVQYAVGWKAGFAKGRFDTELNLYYKELNKLASYKEGYSNLLGDGGWRNKIETGGVGKSLGLEFLLRKNKGNWTGFFAYTLSKTTRQFDKINRGEEFVFDYDRPHSASINVSRKLSEKWSASASWVYQTGLPFTQVLGRQYIPDGTDGYKEVLIYGERNSATMQDYHRLDLGFTCKKINRKGLKAEWNYSVYNAYSRHNPTAYYYNTHPMNIEWDSSNKSTYEPLNLYKVSFFPIIPTVSYKVYFE